jgi:hypothetical protein
MIRVTCANTIVTVHIDTASFSFPMEFNAGSRFAAQLLRDRMARTLAEAVQEARRAAYSDGYKAGRGHQERKTYFSGMLT